MTVPATFSVSEMSWKLSMVAPSGSGMVVQSSTLPSLRSSFSAT